MNYLEMSWPTIPDEIETQLLKLCANHPDEAEKLAKEPRLTFFQYDAPDYLKQWVYENLAEINDEYTIQLQIWKFADYGLRHIDKKRDYSYNYLLSEHPGITRFFEDDGTFIESVKYEYKKWYKHMGSVKYHDVIHVNNFRPAVTIYKRTEVSVPESVRSMFWRPPT
jgi:hypothetical protein